MKGRIPQSLKIDVEKGWFIANGNKYYIQDTITMGRYKEYKKLSHILTYGATPEELHSFVKFVIAQHSSPLTGMTIHRVLERAFNLEDAYKSFLNNDPDPWFRFGALFINREGEDITTSDEKVIRAKIDDWISAGVDANDFFLLCARQLPNLRIKYTQSRPENQASGLVAAAKKKNRTTTEDSI